MRPKRTKTIKMVFKREELLYDIKNNAYVIGDVMPKDNPHSSHQVQDICEDGNIDRVTRVLDIAHAECTEALYPFSKEDVEQETEMDDTPTYPSPPAESTGGNTDYTISLLVPDDYSKTTVNLLVRYIHEYMVYRVLYDWLDITYPAAAGAWRAKADEAKEGMQEAVNFRTGRARLTQSPF